VAAPPAPVGSPATVDLGRVAETLVTRHRSGAKTAGVEVAIEVAPGTPAAGVDGELLVRAADNLVGNAIENAPPGSSVRLVIGPDAELGEGKLALTVVDRGTVHDPARALSSETAPRIARRRSLGARYGRGLALLAADLAAEAAGARLELAVAVGERRRRLVVPAAATEPAADADARPEPRG
jgi:K+-sensing histidine kinase KdpD